MQKLERACYLDLEEKRVMLTALRLACCSCRIFLLIWMFDFGVHVFSCVEVVFVSEEMYFLTTFLAACCLRRTCHPI